MGLLDRDYVREKPILSDDYKQIQRFDILDTSVCPKGNKVLNCYKHRIGYLANTNDQYTWDCPACRRGEPVPTETKTPRPNSVSIETKLPRLNSVSTRSGPRDRKKMMAVMKEMADSDRGEELRDILLVIEHKSKDAWSNGRRDIRFTDQELSVWRELMVMYEEKSKKVKRLRIPWASS
jgi:hypothetical protein